MRMQELNQLNPNNPLAPSFPRITSLRVLLGLSGVASSFISSSIRRESSEIHTLRSGQNLDVDPPCGNFLINWIPACAEMTSLWPNGLLWVNKFRTNALASTLGVLLSICSVASAHATLGGDSSSVETDRIRMKVQRAASQNLASTGSYTVHESTLPSGTLVRQYVSNAGVVFAVTWSGPFIPDLRQLLGIHFDTMVARQARQSSAGHRSFNQHEGDLVIESGGHPRSFAGRAYLKSAIPANVTEQEIQ